MGTVVEKYLSEKNKNVRTLTIVAVVITSILGIIAGVDYIITHMVPGVDIISVDFEKGICVLKVGGSEKTLIGDDTLSVRGSWGVKFGTVDSGDDTEYRTVELVREGMVYKVLAKADEKLIS